MFNKGGFNTSFYDRSVVTKVSLGINIQANGNMVLNLRPVFNLSGSFGGSSGLNSDITAVTDINPGVIAGHGDFQVTHLVFFFLPLATSMIGISDFQMSMGIQMPIEGITFVGSGDISGNNFEYFQNMDIELRSSGGLQSEINLVTPIGDINFSGGDYWVSPELRTLLPLENVNFVGSGTLKLRRIGAIDRILFELEDINLLPGQTIIIDTDLLNVFVNGLLDVSSVTPESVFFELLPGETNIVIENSPNEPVEVDVVWQNRWL